MATTEGEWRNVERWCCFSSSSLSLSLSLSLSCVCKLTLWRICLPLFFFYLISGAPFHFHGNAINVLLAGEKEWLFVPPSKSTYSRVHPRLWKSTMEELRQKTDRHGNKKFYLCKQPANSLMYVPKMWSHSVLNTDEKEPTVGVAIEFQMMGGGGRGRGGGGEKNGTLSVLEKTREAVSRTTDFAKWKNRVDDIMI